MITRLFRPLALFLRRRSLGKLITKEIVCAALVLTTLHSSHADEVLYGATGASGGGTFGTIDQTTGAFTPIGPLQDANGNSYGLTGLDYNPTSGVLYGATNNNSPTSPQNLVTIDPATGRVTLVGPYGTGDVSSDITFRSDGALFGWMEPGTDQLSSINPVTGAATNIGDGTLNTYGSGLAFSGSDMLYFAPNGDTYDGGVTPDASDSGVLLTLDPGTGSPTSVVALTGGSGNYDAIGALTFNDANILYGAVHDFGTNTRIIIIDPVTGAITTVGPSVNRLDALVFGPAVRGPVAVLVVATPGGAPVTMIVPVSLSSPKAKPAPIRVIDNGAIASARTTGLLVPVIQRNVVQSASNGAIRDLNSRLFRARSGVGIRPAGESGMASAGTFLRYLNLAQALGLSSGEVITPGDGAGVPVSVNDTLLTGGSMMTVSAGPGGKNVVDKGPIVDPGPQYTYNRFEAFSEFNYGFYEQDNLTELVRGFDSDTYSGSVGAEYRAFPWLHVGGAFSYLESDTNIGSNYGNIDLDGTLLSGYATAFYGDFYVDALYSYGQFDNDIRRNTLLGNSAQGNTESQTHNVDVNVGYTLPITETMSLGPILGLNYATGDIDGYTETGGRNANLIYPDDDFESTIGRLGGHLTWYSDTPVGKVTVQGRAGWAHEFTPDDDPVSAELATSPYLLVSGGNARRIGGFTAESDGAYAGEDWLELGASVRLDLSRRWNVQLDYEGQFARDDASAHFVGLKLSYEWDTMFLSALGN